MKSIFQQKSRFLCLILTAVTGYGVDYHLFNSSFPHEHFDSTATQTANGYGPTTPTQLKTTTVSHFPSPFVFLTRTPSELYVLGGISTVLGTTGAPLLNYIAKADPITLAEQKRTSLDCPPSVCPFNQVWAPSGAVHDNGFLYVVAESRIWKLDNNINVLGFYDLPAKDGAYNSMKILSDGNILVKFMGNTGGTQDFSAITVVTPNLETVIADFRGVEKAYGRISVLVRGSVEHLYWPGVTAARRYRYIGGSNPSLTVDPSWQYSYRTETSTQVGPAGLITFVGDNAYFADNCIPSLPHEGPIRLHRVNLDNSADAQALAPWPENLSGFHFNKHISDPTTGVIVVADETGKRMAGFRYAGSNQYVRLWDLPHQSKIIASASNGRLYTTAATSRGEDILILDIVTGQTISRIPRAGTVPSAAAISVGNNRDIIYAGGLNNNTIRISDRR